MAETKRFELLESEIQMEYRILQKLLNDLNDQYGNLCAVDSDDLNSLKSKLDTLKKWAHSLAEQNDRLLKIVEGFENIAKYNSPKLLRTPDIVEIISEEISSFYEENRKNMQKINAINEINCEISDDCVDVEVWKNKINLGHDWNNNLMDQNRILLKTMQDFDILIAKNICKNETLKEVQFQDNIVDNAKAYESFCEHYRIETLELLLDNNDDISNESFESTDTAETYNIDREKLPEKSSSEISLTTHESAENNDKSSEDEGIGTSSAETSTSLGVDSESEKLCGEVEKISVLV